LTETPAGLVPRAGMRRSWVQLFLALGCAGSPARQGAPPPRKLTVVGINDTHGALLPTPPPFRNHGNYVVSVAELSRWLAEKAEEAGAYILTETSATQLLVEDGVVRGVRSGDKGRGKDGEPLGNFEPGSDLAAQATVLAEGTWGHLTGAAIREFDLSADREPQVWSLGVKEVWEVPKPLDRIIHTLGWPLRYRAKYREFGGSWIYPMGEDKVSLGFVVGLDYTDATLSGHDVLQEFKQSRLVRKILEGGKRVTWGAKAIPEGGYWAMPKLTAPGLALAGDGAGMVNVPRLKGIHYAIHAGMLAADAIYRELKAGSTDFGDYEKKVEDSIIGEDLYETRNMKQPFSKGFFVGGAITNAMGIASTRMRTPSVPKKLVATTTGSLSPRTGDAKTSSAAGMAGTNETA